MKNLTRVLALVLTFAMMISTVAMAATFADIEEGSTYAEATSVLADLGILKGYEDGTFGADKVITRAEVVAVVNRLQGLSDAAKAAGGATQYTDVPSTEWYAGDVNLATQMGIISGDGNGLFRPNDQVKYEEAVKMIVAALGYNQEYVLKRGGWPTGYLVIATEAEISKGMSAGAGDPAYRGIVAKLAYNALTAPTFAFKEYSTDGKAIYAVNESKITLEEKLQTSKLTGYVSANAITALEGQTTENDEVNFVVTTDKVGKAVVEDAWTIAKTNEGVVYGRDTFKVGATDIAATLGFTTDIYVAENEDGEWEIVSYVINNVKNKTVVIEDTTTIMTADAPNFESKLDGSDDDYLSVYDDEVDTTNTMYDLDAAATLIVNGQRIGTMAANAATPMYSLSTDGATDLGTIYAPAYGEVALLDNNNDGDYDFVFVTSYEVAVVEDVVDTATAKKIFTKNGDIIDLTYHFEGKTGYVYSIELDGAEAALADLQEYDVIAVAKTKNDKSYDILATRATVSGLISEADTTPAGLVDDEFIVDGTAYKVANLADQASSDLDNVNVGDEVTFYLDAFNNVAFVEKTSSASKNYAFIISAGELETVGDVTYQVRLLDKEGNIATYDLAEKVRFADEFAAGVAVSVEAETVADAIEAKIASGIVNVTPADDDAMAAYIDEYAQRIITYKTNSNGDISEIVFAGARNNGKESYLTYAGNVVTGAKYNAKTGRFNGAQFVDENTVVFNLPIKNGVTKEDLSIDTVASLTHDEEYDVAFLSIDDENFAKVMIVANNDATVGQGSNLAIVTKVMAANNAEYEEIYNITFVQNGEVKTLATTYELAQDITAIKAGDVFEYSVNGEGAMDAIALGDFDGAAWDGSLAAVSAYDAAFDEDEKQQYVFGVVYAKSNNRVVTIGAENGETHAIAADANFYLIDLNKTKNAISVSSYAEIRAYKETPAGDLIEDNDYAVFLKYYNDEVIDVVIYKGYLTNN